MPPAGLAILLGSGPTTGAGIARILANPAHANLAVALLSRTGSDSLASDLRKSSQGGVLKAFKTDTSESQLKSAFEAIQQWNKDEFGNKLKLKIAVWNIKHSHKTPFEQETAQVFGESLQVYVTGAMSFAQLCTQWMLGQWPDVPDHAMHKRGTLIFTGTLGALRTNAGFAAYGAGRSGVRMLAQSLAREYSARGIHVVHAIANGGITDNYHSFGHGDGTGTGSKSEDAEKVLKGERIRAESVGKLYVQFMDQGCDLWCHEVDMRPAAEKF